MDFEMLYKYGTIYREVLHSPFRFDFCYFMIHLGEFRTHPLGNEFVKIMEESIPGFVRPCPWKVIENMNMHYLWIFKFFVQGNQGGKRINWNWQLGIFMAHRWL